MSRLMRLGAAAVALMVVVSANAAVIRVDGTFSNYTTVVGAPDPYVLGLPETYSLVLNTSGSSITDGTLTFTGNSGKQFPVTGGVINIGATTDFTGITMPTTGGGIGGTVNMSFSLVIPNNTQAGLDTLIGKPGSISLFGFPFFNGNQGFYNGSAVGVTVPEPTTIGAMALALPLARRRRR